MNLHELWRNLVESPRLVKLLVIFYGLQGIYLLFILSSFIFSLFVYLARGRTPEIIQQTGGMYMILVILPYGIGALLYLPIAWGILAAKGWARILGVIVSTLVLIYLIPATIAYVNLFFTYVLHPHPTVNLFALLQSLGTIVIPTGMNITSIYLLLRPAEVKAHFKKKRTSEEERAHITGHAKGGVMLIGRKARIALILWVCSLFAYYLGTQVVVRYHIIGWLFPEFGLIDKGYAVMCMPASVLTIVGLALYVVGRRELKKRPIKHPNRITSSVCPILGVVLLFLGGYAFLWGLAGALYMSRSSLIYSLFIISSPFLLLSVLWVISGIILIIDSWRDLS